MCNAIDSKPPNRLFFTIINKRFFKLQPKFFTHLQTYYEDHLGLSVKVSPKMWRVWVNQYKLGRLEIPESAAGMQHSVDTNTRHYTWGNREDSSVQLTEFLEQYYGGLVIDHQAAKSPIPTGQCRSFGNPEAISQASNFKPNCIQTEGCFTCQHHAVLADPKDLRKLLSYKYVLLATKRLANTEQEFFRLFGFILQSIDRICELILETKKVSASELENIKKDIFEHQKLEPVWQRKLDLLIDLDVI